MPGLPASPTVVPRAELGAALVDAARQVGTPPRTSLATRAAKPREVDAGCTMAGTGGSDVIALTSIA